MAWLQSDLYMCLDSFRQHIGEILLTFFDYFVSVKLCKQTFTNDSFMIFFTKFCLAAQCDLEASRKATGRVFGDIDFATFTVLYQNG